MYYGMIVLAVAMFGACFACNDIYRAWRGSSLAVSMESSFFGSIAGLAVLLVFGGFSVECTPFTLLMALLATLNGLAFTYCTLKALDVINLSLFSLFSMLGGMLLPFLQGILFFHEPMTIAKAVCLALIVLALLLTVSRGEQKRGTIYYIGVFLLNGLSGVLSKLYTEAPYPKASPAGYSFWCAALTVLLAGVFWAVLAMRGHWPKGMTWRSCGLCAASGAVNRFANFLLVIALVHVDASVQYPMITGGVMIVSTLLCFFGNRKPNKRELLSVLLAFAGLLALFVIPV